MTLFCVYSLTLFNKFRQSPQNITTAQGGGFLRGNKKVETRTFFSTFFIVFKNLSYLRQLIIIAAITFSQNVRNAIDNVFSTMNF